MSHRDDNDYNFDDRMNNKTFTTMLNNTTYSRPKLWPKSVSELQRYTFHSEQTPGFDFDQTRGLLTNNQSMWSYDGFKNVWTWEGTGPRFQVMYDPLSKKWNRVF